ADPGPGGGTGGGTGPTGDGGYTGGGNGDKGNGGDGKGGKGNGANGQEDNEPKPDGSVGDHRDPMEEPSIRRPDGTPTDANPSVTIADFGPAPMGVPNFVIDQFTIPPFLLPIYQACGTQYGVPWEVLASINRIETNFGQLATVTSYAGAVGWMQFMPATWEAYGVDANDDGQRDPYNPVDAICGAARYLQASGAETDLRGAIFAYNHADWYVDEVLLYAEQYGDLPDDLIGSLTGLTEGAHFPVAADARYADDISERELLANSEPGKGESASAGSELVESSPTRRGIDIYSRKGAPVVAVNDGTVRKVGRSKKLGRYVVLEDNYGNRYTYSGLGKIAAAYPVPKQRKLKASDFELPGAEDEVPTRPASAGRTPAKAHKAGDGKSKPKASQKSKSRPADTGDSKRKLVNTENMRERLFAFPDRRGNGEQPDLTAQVDSLLKMRFPGYESFKSYLGGVMRFDRKTMELRRLEEGSKVLGGTVLGRIGEVDEGTPRVHFTIRPAGRGAPLIDPKPILDGWKLLEATAIYRAAGENPFEGQASTGQVLLMSKTQLIDRVLDDSRIEIYSCGREDIQSGQIDRRVLAMLEYLAERGFRLTITSLKCGHSVYSASGNISQHSIGSAVDIAQINGLPVLGNQGAGSITEALISDILELQGPMVPDQVISLMDMGGPTFVMSDHADHVHVGYAATGESTLGGAPGVERVLDPDQWERLIDRIGKIDNPKVLTSPSKFALPAKSKDKGRGRASGAHIGE
ncbi:MAG: lytic murein transglycosylase, partial [Solirubrobacterales bacterium]|nr:lytic murein transglycosylase [Solirubrobacterales bacterium]